jgi:hypothetical protein
VDKLQEGLMRRTVVGWVLAAALLMPVQSMAVQTGQGKVVVPWWKALLTWVLQAASGTADQDEVKPSASVIIDPNG